jgi:hypothetical protein
MAINTIPSKEQSRELALKSSHSDFRGKEIGYKVTLIGTSIKSSIV